MEKKSTSQNPTLTAALSYAKRGWYVFPARFRQQQKLSWKSANSSNGRAWGMTQDPDEICRDFARPDRTAIGLPTGAVNGFFVIEVDTPEGHEGVDGRAALKQLESQHGALPNTLMGESPSGSLHRYYKQPGTGIKVRNSTSQLGPGIDVRGDGGMVIAPPSLRPGKGAYRWLNDDPIADAPEWLITLVTTKPEAAKSPSKMPDWMERHCKAHPEMVSGRQRMIDLICPEEVEEITAALAVIPSDDYQVWFEVGSAVHLELDEEGWPLFREWSKTSKKFNERECEKKWKECAKVHGHTAGTIFHHASEADPNWRDAVKRAPDVSASTSDPSIRHLLRTSAEFVSEFTPPDYLIDGILLRTYLYALTAPTGHGKTAVALAISIHAAMAWPLGEHGVDKTKVLYLAGENDIDVRMRWIKTCEENELEPKDVDVVFMPGVEKLSDDKFQAQLKKETDELGPFGLVFVDTSAAYNEAEDDNANMQMQEHARILRRLTKTIPGGPTIIVLCHPVKTPNMDSLVPKGGGNFLNEIDGNLCCKMDKRDFVVDLHTAGKFRGPEFAPLTFALKVGTSEKIKDSKGRMIKTVTARIIDEEEREELEGGARREQTDLLILIREDDKISLRNAGTQLGWSKSKVHRLLTNLIEGKYVTRDADDRLTITEKGVKLITDRLGAAVCRCNGKGVPQGAGHSALEEWGLSGGVPRGTLAMGHSAKMAEKRGVPVSRDRTQSRGRGLIRDPSWSVPSHALYLVRRREGGAEGS